MGANFRERKDNRGDVVVVDRDRDCEGFAGVELIGRMF